MCDFMETYSVLIFSIVGSVAAVFLFYKNKLKTPLQELKDASQLLQEKSALPGRMWCQLRGRVCSLLFLHQTIHEQDAVQESIHHPA